MKHVTHRLGVLLEYFGLLSQMEKDYIIGQIAQLIMKGDN